MSDFRFWRILLQKSALADERSAGSVRTAMRQPWRLYALPTLGDVRGLNE